MNLKKIKDGAGAGYTINSEILSVEKVNSLKAIAYDKSYNTVTVECDIDATCHIERAYSYYEGSYVNADAPCKITSFEIQLYYENDLTDLVTVPGDEVLDLFENGTEQDIVSNVNLDFVASTFRNSVEGLEIECNYGGGWTHSAYDGTISDSHSKLESYDIITLDAYTTDESIIKYIDRAVQGDTASTEYVVRVGGDDVEYCDDETTCISMAKQIAREQPNTSVAEVVYYDNEDFEGNIEFVDSDLLWSNY